AAMPPECLDMFALVVPDTDAGVFPSRDSQPTVLAPGPFPRSRRDWTFQAPRNGSIRSSAEMLVIPPIGKLAGSGSCSRRAIRVPKEFISVDHPGDRCPIGTPFDGHESLLGHPLQQRRRAPVFSPFAHRFSAGAQQTGIVSGPMKRIQV